MLQSSTFRFLKDLSRNNNRDWFEKNRNRYEESKKDFDDFTDRVITELSKVNPKLKGLKSKDCVFRIYRDVRFSKNKDPYKSSFSALIDENGRKSTHAGFYFQVDPAGEFKSFLAGGVWQPEAVKLKAIRQEIEYHTEEFLGIINDKNFKKEFKELEDHKLKKTPKGIDKDDPNAELYKYTSFIVSKQLDEKDFYSKDILKQLSASYRIMQPLLTFLNKA